MTQQEANEMQTNARAHREQAVAGFFNALTKLAETAEKVLAAELGKGTPA